MYAGSRGMREALETRKDDMTTFNLAEYCGGVWTTGGVEVPQLGDYIAETFTVDCRCPYCGGEMEFAAFEPAEEDVDPEGRHSYRLWSCFHCGYWQSYGFEGNPDLVCTAASSVLGRFEHRIPEGCYAEWARCLRADPSRWHSMHPTDMEKLVADIFKANFAHAEVNHVGGSGDGGVDVILVEANGTRWLTQVKRRKDPGSQEGPDTLRNLVGAMVLKGGTYGIVATTADHFSPGAIGAQKAAAQRGYVIQLLDRGKLIRMLGALLPQRPWQPHLAAIFPYHEVGVAASDLARFFCEKLSTNQLRLWMPPC